MGDFSNAVSTAKPKALNAAPFVFSTASGGITNTTAVTAKAAEANTVFGVHGIDYINPAATASEFEIYSGANVIYRGYAPASMTVPASVPGLSSEPLFTNAGEDLKIKMVTTSTATRFNVRSKRYAPA